MKAKKIILLLISLQTQFCWAGFVQQTFISTTEQKVMGHLFKHVICSAHAQTDEYFIDGRKVSQERYEQDLENFEKQERQKTYEQQIAARRSRIEFAQMMQVEIAAKLVRTIIDQIHQLSHKIQNPTLQNFLVFTDTTVHSQDQFAQLQKFIEYVTAALDEKIEEYDVAGLQAWYHKLEAWPARLEKFFQDTVQQAIKKSDDTAMLKELLKLVADSSGMY